MISIANLTQNDWTVLDKLLSGCCPAENSEALCFRISKLVSCLLLRIGAETTRPSRAWDFYQISFQGTIQDALVDNQASASIITLAFAKKHNITVKKASIPFLLVDGSSQMSIGSALVDCSLPGRPDQVIRMEFHVFYHALFPLIVGREHLLDLATLKHQASVTAGSDGCLLEPSDARYTPRPPLGIKFPSTLHGQHANATIVLDTGSTVNLMSLCYARRMRLNVDDHVSVRASLQLGNGRLVSSAGIVRTPFSVSGLRKQMTLVTGNFVVMENLPFDLAMGNPCIRAFGLWDEASASSRWTRDMDSGRMLCSLRTNPKTELEDALADPSLDGPASAVQRDLAEYSAQAKKDENLRRQRNESVRHNNWLLQMSQFRSRKMQVEEWKLILEEEIAKQTSLLNSTTARIETAKRDVDALTRGWPALRPMYASVLPPLRPEWAIRELQRAISQREAIAADTRRDIDEDEEVLSTYVKELISINAQIEALSPVSLQSRPSSTASNTRKKGFHWPHRKKNTVNGDKYTP